MPKLPTSMGEISTVFPTLSEGQHQLTIKKAEMGLSKAKKPMLTLEIVGTNDDGEKVTIFEYITFVKKDSDEQNTAGLRQLKKLVEAWLGEERANDPNFDTDELAGVTGMALVTLDEEEYQGETSLRNNIKRYIPN